MLESFGVKRQLFYFIEHFGQVCSFQPPKILPTFFNPESEGSFLTYSYQIMFKFQQCQEMVVVHPYSKYTEFKVMISEFIFITLLASGALLRSDYLI